MRLKLRIQSIPISSWGISLASRLPKDKWDKIRREVYRKAGYRCEVCLDGSGTLNCHEQWSFDDRKRIQRLVGFQCVCGLCHDTIHYGRSSQVHNAAYLEELMKHWMEVNRKTKKDWEAHLKETAETNRKRANRRYLVKVGNRYLD